MIMKKFEIKAFSLEEAKEKALEYGLKVIRNVTMSWKNSEFPDVNSNEFKMFAAEQFDKNRLNDTVGVGLIVVLQPGTADDKTRPYKLIDNKVKGSVEKKRVFEIRLSDNDQLVGEAYSKNEAIRKAKELMVEYKKDMITKVVYRVLGDKGTAFELKYSPSIKTAEGKYVVFGNINDTF